MKQKSAPLVTTKQPCEVCAGTGKVKTASPAALRARRVAAGWTLRGFAKHVRLSPAYVSDVERGNRRATERLIEVYAGLPAAT